MGQPTPPGDIPLYEGLGTEWNDIVGALPEDQRALLAPKIKERLDSFAPLKQWEDFNKSGVTPQQASTALNISKYMEDNPREVYETLGKHLGITTQQAKQVVEQVQEETDNGNDDPRIKNMQGQLELLAQIILEERNQSVQSKQASEADQWLDNELSNLKKKYGDVNEREIIMRMSHLDMSAEDAYNDYNNVISEARKTRPAPMVIGSGGNVPRNAIDPTKLDGKATRDLVAQMMQASQDAK